MKKKSALYWGFHGFQIENSIQSTRIRANRNCGLRLSIQFDENFTRLLVDSYIAWLRHILIQCDMSFSQFLKRTVQMVSSNLKLSNNRIAKFVSNTLSTTIESSTSWTRKKPIRKTWKTFECRTYPSCMPKMMQKINIQIVLLMQCHINFDDIQNIEWNFWKLKNLHLNISTVLQQTNAMKIYFVISPYLSFSFSSYFCFDNSPQRYHFFILCLSPNQIKLATLNNIDTRQCGRLKWWFFRIDISNFVFGMKYP